MVSHISLITYSHYHDSKGNCYPQRSFYSFFIHDRSLHNFLSSYFAFSSFEAVLFHFRGTSATSNPSLFISAILSHFLVFSITFLKNNLRTYCTYTICPQSLTAFPFLTTAKFLVKRLGKFLYPIPYPICTQNSTIFCKILQ